MQQPPQIVINSSVIGIGCASGSTGSITSNVSGGTPPFNYMWSNGATTASITGLAGGTYTLTVTDSGGCTNTAVWTIPVVPPLSVTGTSTNTTCGGNNGTAAVIASGTPPYSYSWTPPVSTTATASGLSAGIYIVQVTDSNGCIVTDTITVNSIATFTVTPSSNTANCAGTGGSGSISVSGISGPYTFQLSPSGGTDSIATNLNAGTYTVVITDANNCSQTVTVVIGQMTSSVTVTTLVTQSPCDTTTLATIGTNSGNGTSPYTYIWTTGATTATVTGLGAGTYTIIVTDANQCTAAASATIAPFNPVSFTTSSSQSCSESSTGSASVAAPTGGSPPYSYQWSNGSANASINGIAGGNYTVTVTDANSCSVTAIVNVTSLPAINVSVLPDSSNGAPPLTVNFTNSNTGGITYSWNFGDGSTASTHDASHIYTSDSTYNGYLVVTNLDGCTDTGKFVVIVLTNSEFQIYNVFTPNSDTHNDFWSIKTHGVLNLSTEVYNRWGEQIFERDYVNNLTDGVNDVWDGITKNGKKAAAGTYFYIVKAHGTDKDYDQSGTITLIRDTKK
ncbi:MAG: gliding motility-associated C-terminal domain-containing protein [Bacteroidota bacterium]